MAWLVGPSPPSLVWMPGFCLGPGLPPGGAWFLGAEGGGPGGLGWRVDLWWPSVPGWAGVLSLACWPGGLIVRTQAGPVGGVDLVWD